MCVYKMHFKAQLSFEISTSLFRVGCEFFFKPSSHDFWKLPWQQRRQFIAYAAKAQGGGKQIHNPAIICPFPSVSDFHWTFQIHFFFCLTDQSQNNKDNQLGMFFSENNCAWLPIYGLHLQFTFRSCIFLACAWLLIWNAFCRRNPLPWFAHEWVVLQCFEERLPNGQTCPRLWWSVSLIVTS